MVLGEALNRGGWSQIVPILLDIVSRRHLNQPGSPLSIAITGVDTFDQVRGFDCDVSCAMKELAPVESSSSFFVEYGV